MPETMSLENTVMPFIRLAILFGLQIFLCRRKNKWLGMILPTFYFGQSVYLLARTIMQGILVEYGLLAQIAFAFLLPNLNLSLIHISHIRV